MAPRRLSAASLEPVGTLVLIEALRLRFFHGMHVEKMWHSDAPLSWSMSRLARALASAECSPLFELSTLTAVGRSLSSGFVCTLRR